MSKNVSVLIWAGDADWICNWKGNLYTADNLRFSGHDEFKAKKLAKFTVNGKHKGEYKTVRNLSYLRVFNAGHTVMAYRKCAELKFRWLLTRSRTRSRIAGVQADDAEKADITYIDDLICRKKRATTGRMK